MSRKGLIIVAVLFLVGFALLALVARGYRKVEDMQSMAKAMAAVRRDFPAARPVTGAELAALQEGPESLFLFDLRSKEEFEVSRLHHAVHDPETEELLSFAGRAGRVVLYDSHGARSAKTAEELERRWGKAAYYLEGGIFLWANEGRPLVDAAGGKAIKVHPRSRLWGRLLDPEVRGEP